MTPDTNVLITGVTGLIGGELARRLSRCEVGKVFCLIRPNPMADVRSRLIERMQVSEDSRAAGWGDRLESVAGDVVVSRFGLSDHDDAQVTESVDMIIHCASELSFIRDARCRARSAARMSVGTCSSIKVACSICVNHPLFRPQPP